jgi:hypothetical protein
LISGAGLGAALPMIIVGVKWVWGQGESLDSDYFFVKNILQDYRQYAPMIDFKSSY